MRWHFPFRLASITGAKDKARESVLRLLFNHGAQRGKQGDA